MKVAGCSAVAWIRLRGIVIDMREGEELVARMVADMRERGLEPDAKERELLSIAQDLADPLAELEACVAEDGRSRCWGRGG